MAHNDSDLPSPHCLHINQVMEVRDPLNRLTKYTYDLTGNVNSVLDPQQNPTIFEYESTFNRITKITDVLNQITRNTGGVGAPTITVFTPNTGNAGASVNVSLTGMNLTGDTLATSNPGILVRNVVTTPTAITATFQIAFEAGAVLAI